MGSLIEEKLNELLRNYSIIKEIRGKGLMIGIELEREIAKEVVSKCLSEGLIINNIGKKIIRFLPPLCVAEDDIDKAMKIFKKALLN